MCLHLKQSSSKCCNMSLGAANGDKRMRKYRYFDEANEQKRTNKRMMCIRTIEWKSILNALLAHLVFHQLFGRNEEMKKWRNDCDLVGSRAKFFSLFRLFLRFRFFSLLFFYSLVHSLSGVLCTHNSHVSYNESMV